MHGTYSQRVSAGMACGTGRTYNGKARPVCPLTGCSISFCGLSSAHISIGLGQSSCVSVVHIVLCCSGSIRKLITDSLLCWERADWLSLCLAGCWGQACFCNCNSHCQLDLNRLELGSTEVLGMHNCKVCIPVEGSCQPLVAGAPSGNSCLAACSLRNNPGRLSRVAQHFQILPEPG